MPIYAYRCTACGHAQDVLRKISDPPLSVCPACGAPTFVKQVTAAGFQLKGSGWYVTDFRDGKKAGKPTEGESAAKEGGDSAAAGAEAKTNGDTKAGETKAGDTKAGETKAGDTKSADAKPAGTAAAKAAAPAPAPAAAPAAPNKGRA